MDPIGGEWEAWWDIRVAMAKGERVDPGCTPEEWAALEQRALEALDEDELVARWARERGAEGEPPASLDDYLDVVAEHSAGLSPDPFALDAVLSRRGWDRARWGEIARYWTPRVTVAASPEAEALRERLWRAWEPPPPAPPPLAPPPAPAEPVTETDDTGVLTVVRGWIRSFVG